MRGSCAGACGGASFGCLFHRVVLDVKRTKAQSSATKVIRRFFNAASSINILRL